jgi:hypothetical protein
MPAGALGAFRAGGRMESAAAQLWQPHRFLQAVSQTWWSLGLEQKADKLGGVGFTFSTSWAGVGQGLPARMASQVFSMWS